MIKNSLYIAFVCIVLSSCNWLQDAGEGVMVARVEDAFLYQSDIDDYLQDFPDRSDSLVLVSNYINKWATQQLLLDGAKRNVSRENQNKFSKLAQEYKIGLYTSAYKEALINRQLDTIVSMEEASQFYETNKKNFQLNEDLLKLRYIQIAEDYNNINQIQEAFIRFNKEDQSLLDSLKLQFNKYFLKDSIWVKKSVVIKSVNPVNPTNADNLLKKTNFIQLRDSLGLYLISIGETLSRKRTAPLEYVRPTINQIIKNKRKLALVKKLEKEIKDDAIKNNKFEIYN